MSKFIDLSLTICIVIAIIVIAPIIIFIGGIKFIYYIVKES